MKINGIILAAGSSSRLGQTKQLVKYKGLSLLQHTEKRVSPWVSQLFVILGHEHQAIQNELNSASFLINDQWHLGIGTSISCGIKSARKNADAVLITLCDQPFIPASHYQKLSHAAKQNPTLIINSSYSNTQGVPAIFPQSYFTTLTNLDSKQGAQALFKNNPQQAISIECEAAALDIDTPHQLKYL